MYFRYQANIRQQYDFRYQANIRQQYVNANESAFMASVHQINQHVLINQSSSFIAFIIKSVGRITVLTLSDWHRHDCTDYFE